MSHGCASLPCPCCGNAAAPFHVDQGILACDMCGFAWKFGGECLRKPKAESVADKLTCRYELGMVSKADFMKALGRG